MSSLFARSILFVPADKINLASKAAVSDADVICIDLEDSIPIDKKMDVRKNLNVMTSSISKTSKALWVRVNSELETCLEDIKFIPEYCSAIVVPKCRDLSHLALIGDVLDRTFPNRICNIIGLVEDAKSILAFENTPFFQKHKRVSALALGVEDLSSDLGVSPNSPLILFQFNRLLTISKNLNLPLIGYPGSIADFKNMDIFEEAVQLASNSGAMGGFCIHPTQISILNNHFSPSLNLVSWANRVVVAFREQSSSGVIVVDNKMVDKPVYERACKILGQSQISNT